jgi:hypothetical protein
MVLSIHEEEGPVDSKVGTTAVTMDAGADIEAAREDLVRRPVRGPLHDHIPPIRPSLDPVHGIVRDLNSIARNGR